MSTIAVSKNNYAVKGNNAKRGSLRERLRKYFEENAAMIASGLLFVSGSANAYTLYRSMK
ncbi:MAG TPA: hypothetical protein H9697_12600 [Candidatus Mediterraneibacter faecavium]|uniref:Uncharacterized protein n=1 Tax=Candidatus Mediterraneibacter faecavium TaxID=2838668 RepID=A0A9D2TNN2_9FIRM|nr:hypothetical protein [Candidatus Mediterraneibacter faecavium]